MTVLHFLLTNSLPLSGGSSIDKFKPCHQEGSAWENKRLKNEIVVMQGVGEG